MGGALFFPKNKEGVVVGTTNCDSLDKLVILV